MADYNEAIHLDLNFAGAYYNRGNLLSQKGDLGGALTDLTGALHLEATSAGGYFNPEIVYQRLGLLGDAIADFRKTLQLNPRHEDASRALSALGVAP